VVEGVSMRCSRQGQLEEKAPRSIRHDPNASLPRRPTREVEQHQHRELITFCGALLDRHEDAIVDALQSDDFGSEDGGCFGGGVEVGGAGGRGVMGRVGERLWTTAEVTGASACVWRHPPHQQHANTTATRALPRRRRARAVRTHREALH